AAGSLAHVPRRGARSRPVIFRTPPGSRCRMCPGPGEGGRGSERQSQLVALAAWSIRAATICGWLSIAQWDEAGTSRTFWAFARLYIQRSVAGGMALSWPATSPHTGIVCHAAAVVG